MMSRSAQDIPNGGARTFQLPPDPSIAPTARALLTTTMQQLALDQRTIENGSLAVSELATNAQQHACQAAAPHSTNTVPELWVWARTCPSPELIVSVFDGKRDQLPEEVQRDPMSEGGRGLAIVAAVSAGWGVHHSRSRHCSSAALGKAVWFALPLPGPWPGSDQIINPAFAAHRLLISLGARGIAATHRSDAKGISLVQVGDLNIWVEPKHFSWSDRTGDLVRHPLIDLQETTEHLVHQVEEASS